MKSIAPVVCAAALVASLTSSSNAHGDEGGLGIAVLSLRTDNGVDPGLAPTLTGLVSSKLQKTGVFHVVTEDDVKQMVSFDQMKTALSCDDPNIAIDANPPVSNLVVHDPGVGHKLHVSWDVPHVAGLTSVLVRRNAGGACPSTFNDAPIEVKLAAATATSVDDGNDCNPGDPPDCPGAMKNGISYCYVAVANYGGVLSRITTASGTPTDTSPPAPVTSLTATPGPVLGGSGEVPGITLAWTPPAEPIAGYKLVTKIGSQPANETDGAVDDINNPNALEFADPQNAGVHAFYALYAVDDVGLLSEPAFADAIADAGPPPDPVTNLQAVADPSGISITVSWTLPTTNFDPSNGDEIVVIAKTGSAPTSDTDGDNLTPTSPVTSIVDGNATAPLTEGEHRFYAVFSRSATGAEAQPAFADAIAHDTEPPTLLVSSFIVTGLDDHTIRLTVKTTPANGSDVGDTATLVRGSPPSSCPQSPTDGVVVRTEPADATGTPEDIDDDTVPAGSQDVCYALFLVDANGNASVPAPGHGRTMAGPTPDISVFEAPCSGGFSCTSPPPHIASVSALSDGTVVVAGDTGDGIDPFGGQRGGFVARIDRNGNLVWTKQIGAAQNVVASVHATNIGGDETVVAGAVEKVQASDVPVGPPGAAADFAIASTNKQGAFVFVLDQNGALIAGTNHLVETTFSASSPIDVDVAPANDGYWLGVTGVAFGDDLTIAGIPVAAHDTNGKTTAYLLHLHGDATLAGEAQIRGLPDQVVSLVASTADSEVGVVVNYIGSAFHAQDDTLLVSPSNNGTVVYQFFDTGEFAVVTEPPAAPLHGVHAAFGPDFLIVAGIDASNDLDVLQFSRGSNAKLWETHATRQGSVPFVDVHAVTVGADRRVYVAGSHADNLVLGTAGLTLPGTDANGPYVVALDDTGTFLYARGFGGGATIPSIDAATTIAIAGNDVVFGGDVAEGNVAVDGQSVAAPAMFVARFGDAP